MSGPAAGGVHLKDRSKAENWERSENCLARNARTTTLGGQGNFLSAEHCTSHEEASADDPLVHRPDIHLVSDLNGVVEMPESKPLTAAMLSGFHNAQLIRFALLRLANK